MIENIKVTAVGMMRTKEEYDKAQKIIKVLIKNGCIKSSSGIDEYVKDWDMVFEILDLTKEE